ncbi:hypothetical protein EVA_08639 [gut metagenome]|uniref:Uncharacterized protein n=1 Tax=gut metagenome TaxID=749906 RepID=J9GSM9_9ZZZZ
MPRNITHYVYTPRRYKLLPAICRIRSKYQYLTKVDEFPHSDNLFLKN